MGKVESGMEKTHNTAEMDLKKDAPSKGSIRGDRASSGRLTKKRRKPLDLSMGMFKSERVHRHRRRKLEAEIKQEGNTLARLLGSTSHLSPLFRRIEKAIGDEDPATCLKGLAVKRGCRHYRGSFKEGRVPTTATELTNEEIAVGLCLGQLSYDPLNIRVAAELLSAETCVPETITRLARQERCETVIGYIAACGQRVEPNNPKWKSILDGLGTVQAPPAGQLPHWSRFVSMTGITPGGGSHTEWLRPKQ